MRILPINNFNIRFTADRKLDELYDDNLVHNFTEEDECYSHDAKIRDAIRAHMYSRFLPSYGPEVGRSNAYAETLEDLYIPNLQKISIDSYRGATLAKNIQYLEVLKKQNMKTVIDLVGYFGLEHACQANNIDYHKYPVSADYWGHPIFRTDAELRAEKMKMLSSLELSEGEYNQALKQHDYNVQFDRRIFMRDFCKLVDTINKGAFYIGCEFGEYRTPNILALNTYFNPSWSGKKTYPTSEFIYDKMKNMYLNLTEEDKVNLGFTKGFEENLRIELGLAD